MSYTAEEIFEKLSDEDKVKAKLFAEIYGSIDVDVSDPTSFKLIDSKVVGAKYKEWEKSHYNV